MTLDALAPTPTKPTPAWDTVRTDGTLAQHSPSGPDKIAIHAPIMRGAKVDWRATAESLARDLMDRDQELLVSERALRNALDAAEDERRDLGWRIDNQMRTISAHQHAAHSARASWAWPFLPRSIKNFILAASDRL